MIPEEEKKPKSLVESFVDRLSGDRYNKSDVLWKLVDEKLDEAFMTMDSWDEWHEYLHRNGIVPVRSRHMKYHEEKWYAWANRKNMNVRKSPARQTNETGEFLLVPEKAVEKMIILGMLKCPSSR